MIETVAFVWSNFGPYHVDRLEAATAALAGKYRVVGIELAGASDTYAWERTPDRSEVARVTLFADAREETIPTLRRLSALMRCCLSLGTRHVFLCQYERVEIFLLAVLLRGLGRRVYLMIESKFDDKPRRIWRELLKLGAYLPYNGALVGGPRTRDYLELFGFRRRQIKFGYDTVSTARVRLFGGSPPAPDGVPHRERHFTVLARLVPKKNIAMALDAYALYCRTSGNAARALHICGSGVLEQSLRDKVRELGLSGVVFRGFIQAPEVARTLASSLALILPSTEEPWGLVVNEAVAMGVPILCSYNVGARDLLVRAAINGFAFEPENAAGLARLMQWLAESETEWRRLAEGSLALSPWADTLLFGEGVAQLLGLSGGVTAPDRSSAVVGAP